MGSSETSCRRWTSARNRRRDGGSPPALWNADELLARRDRLGKLVRGPNLTLEESVRAVFAFGGLQDCCPQFPDAPHRLLRTAVVDGAMTVLSF